MPYIKQTDRATLDAKIDELISAIGDVNDPQVVAAAAGKLNYVFTRMLKHFYVSPGPCSYSTLNTAAGILTCCQVEFQRQFVAPYEDTKMAENGPV
jgi:hypothetical protein